MRRKARHVLPLKKIRELDRELKPVEADFGFWLQHVLHWHALFLVVCAVLALGYFSR